MRSILFIIILLITTIYTNTQFAKELIIYADSINYDSNKKTLTFDLISNYEFSI